MTLRGADVIARGLARAGTRQVFALSGNYVMPVFDAALDAKLPLLHARHEAAAESPVVLLSGHAPLAELGKGAFQEMAQAEMAAPAAKAAWTVRSAASLGEDLARAIRMAKAGRPGPVHLSLPSDVLEAEVDVTLPPKEAFFAELFFPQAGVNEEILEALQQAKKLLVIVGPALGDRVPAGEMEQSHLEARGSAAPGGGRARGAEAARCP